MTDDDPGLDRATLGWLAAIDRELLLSAFSHDVRGPITALDGFFEIEEVAGTSPGQLALRRLADLVGVLAARPPRSSTANLRCFEGLPDVTVRVACPMDPLRVALRRLPHGPLAVRLDAAVATLVVPGDAAQLDTEWSLPQVRRWLASPAPPLAAARVQVAARMVGAAAHVEPDPADVARALLLLRFERVPS
jgi:hypothetical protein